MPDFRDPFQNLLNAWAQLLAGNFTQLHLRHFHSTLCIKHLWHFLIAYNNFRLDAGHGLVYILNLGFQHLGEDIGIIYDRFLYWSLCSKKLRHLHDPLLHLQLIVRKFFRDEFNLMSWRSCDGIHKHFFMLLDWVLLP